MELRMATKKDRAIAYLVELTPNERDAIKCELTSGLWTPILGAYGKGTRFKVTEDAVIIHGPVESVCVVAGSIVTTYKNEESP